MWAMDRVYYNATWSSPLSYSQASFPSINGSLTISIIQFSMMFSNCWFPYTLFLHTLFPLYFLSGPTSATTSQCKAFPNTPTWPSLSQWTKLNATLFGQLLAPLPPAAVCDPTLAVFDNASCTYVASQYSFSNFHAQDPVSVMQPNWEDDACLPNEMYKCNLKQFPEYVVNATDASHVVAAVDFAKVHDVRLIVKGTGHDYLGRSAFSVLFESFATRDDRY